MSNVEPAWQEGYDAYSDGDDESDNPYPAGTVNHRYWNDGMAAAREADDS